MIVPELKQRDKISVYETKLELERKFDMKKTVLLKNDNGLKAKSKEMNKKRQELFKKEILAPPRKEEQEKRVELSEEYDSSSDSHNYKSESSDPEAGKDESVYEKVKSKQFGVLNFKNPGSHDPDFYNKKKRKSLSGSSSSSFITLNKGDRNSVATANKPGKFLKGIEQSEIPRIGPESENTSTIKGVFNQITSIVEAQDFKFNKRRTKRENSHDVNNLDSQTLNLGGTQNNEKLFKIVSNQQTDGYSPKNLAFTQTERRKMKPIKKKLKMKSDAGGIYSNPYQIHPVNGAKAPTENHEVPPIDFEHSSDSIRRREFNKQVDNPHDSSRV